MPNKMFRGASLKKIDATWNIIAFPSDDLATPSAECCV
jgi:hypothetical protein